MNLFNQILKDIYFQRILSRLIFWNINSKRYKSLTVNETSIALRPFLFIVHPDLFGKYPKEQAVNEKSLKLLNEHINKLHNQLYADPLELSFHIRNLTLNKDLKFFGDFKLIKLNLDTQDVGEVVKILLTATNLSLDYINAINFSYKTFKEDSKQIGIIDDKWTTYSGYENEYFFKKYKMELKTNPSIPRYKMENSLNTWINCNRLNVLTQMDLAKPIQDEIIIMKNKLISQYKLKDIIWLNSWTLASFRTSLKGLINVLNNIVDSSLNLQGHTITFSNDIGISVHGHIVLQRDIVSNSWTNMFYSLNEKLKILSIIPNYEQTLSSLLGDFKIVRPNRSVILADIYLYRLKQLIKEISDFKDKEPILSAINRDIGGSEISLECTTGSLMVSQSGVILIPSHCPSFLIFDFIKNNLDNVKKVKLNYISMQLRKEKLMQSVKDSLKLLSLIQDEAVSQIEMLSCCHNLINDQIEGRLKSDLTGIKLKISKHYAVTVDGEMCVPWNYII